MKKLAAILCLGALTTGAFAQGLVTFANSGITQISITPKGGTAAAFAAGSAAGSYYFGLLTAATAAGPFTFAGAYATNTAGAGRLGPANNTQAIAGWAPGATMFYEVAGWSGSLGSTFNAGWLTGNFAPGTVGYFGVSAVASGAAGGGVPVPAPALPLFGGAGLSGFNMNAIGTVPEPTSMALAGLGAAALLIFRRRK